MGWTTPNKSSFCEGGDQVEEAGLAVLSKNILAVIIIHFLATGIFFF